MTKRGDGLVHLKQFQLVGKLMLSEGGNLGWLSINKRVQVLNCWMHL